jgi:ParB-like chromosome segregation protein Spo0J
MTSLNIVHRDIATLLPAARNARTHPKKQIRQLANSLREYGFVVPILCDAETRIVSGHGRVEAAKLLGIDRVPTIQIDHLTPEQLRSFAIAENRLSERGGWDQSVLALEIGELYELLPELDFTDFGFEITEIDGILGDPAVDSDEAAPSFREDCAPLFRDDVAPFGLGPYRH